MNYANVYKQIPFQATGLVNMGEIISIAAGGSYTAALRRDGTLLTVGSNSYGELGDNLTGDDNSWARSVYFTSPRVHNLNMFYTNNTLTVECQDIDNNFLCHDIADTQLIYRSL
jgi:alpha-tubulin suppressor-like RCC1 family protein